MVKRDEPAPRRVSTADPRSFSEALRRMPAGLARELSELLGRPPRKDAR